MKGEASIVEEYADSDVSERIEIMIKYYPNFNRLLDGYEKSLGIIIKQEKEQKRRSARGELGVRVQTSGISDPTAREAIDNVMIAQAIKEGEVSEILAELDEEVIRMHELEVNTIQNMREDYSILQDTFYYLDQDEAETLVKYLENGRRTEKLAQL